MATPTEAALSGAALRALEGDAPFALPRDGISFAYGLPDPSLFPTEALSEATEAVLRDEAGTALQYGELLGYPRLRQYIAERLEATEGLHLDTDRIMITGGASQAIVLLTQAFVDPGDAIVVEAPTFVGAEKTFRALGARMYEVPIDEQGMVPAALAETLDQLQTAGTRPKFLYTMPTFHNPAGVTQPLARRRAILRIAAAHELVIIEDDAYGDLRYDGDPLPSLFELDKRSLVIRLGTFSKILAAGLRLGWVAGDSQAVGALAALKFDQATSPYNGALAAEVGLSGRLDPHVERLRAAYREKRDALLEALDRYCQPYARWTRPAGGFFVWLELNDEVDPAVLLEGAGRHGVSYVPGQACFASPGHDQFVRLAFSYVAADEIEEGVRRLGLALAEAVPRGSAKVAI